MMDLVHSPEAPYAEYSRRVIDCVFALLGPSGGLVAGGASGDGIMKRPLSQHGREIWYYLKRLRIIAWQKCGVNPDITWTREQAIQYYNTSQAVDVLVPDPGHPGPMWNPTSPEMPEDVFQQPVSTADILRSMSGRVMSPPSFHFPGLGGLFGDNMDIDFEDDFGEGPSRT